MLKNQRIFITGGAGFIGSLLVGQLVEKNKIVVYDNLTRNSLKDKPYRNHPNLEVVVGDILDLGRLMRNMAGARYVIHCAAVAGVDAVIKHPIKTMKVNLLGSANVFRTAAELHTCKRVICFSTSEVFGQYTFLDDESDTIRLKQAGEARWTYAISKLVEEHFAMAYFIENKLPIVILRPFNIYGPGQVGEGALRTFVQQAIQNKPITIHGDGTQIRAWCYVNDLIDAVMLALEHRKAVGETFNIGNNKAVETIHGLANTVIRVLDSKSEIKFVKKKFPDILLRIPAVRKAKKLLNFEAKVSLEEGIKRTAEYYRRTLNG